MTFSPNSLLLGFYLRKKELATLTGRTPELCGWALRPGSVSGPCPPLVLILAAPLNSVGLCGPVGGSCPPLVLVLSSGRADQPWTH